MNDDNINWKERLEDFNYACSWRILIFIFVLLLSFLAILTISLL